MNKTPPKKVEPAKKSAKTFQQVFDKWFLPFVFVAIICVAGWALWRG